MKDSVREVLYSVMAVSGLALSAFAMSLAFAPLTTRAVDAAAGAPAAAPAQAPPAAPLPVRAVTAARPKSRPTASRKPGKPGKPAPATAYRKTSARGVGLHIVQFDPKRKDVRLAVALSERGLGTRDSWSGMVNRAGPKAAITGTYFCTTTSLPVGTLVAEGSTLYHGPIGTVFAYTPGRGAAIVTSRPNRAFQRAEWDVVVRAGPRLLTGGRVTLYPEAEGFRDPAILGRKKRTALAITKSGKLLFVATRQPVLLRTFARSLAAVGAVDAMALDGGASTGLYYGGRTRIAPGRALTNLLVLYDNMEHYAARRSRLVSPGARLTVKRKPEEPAA